MPWGDRGRQDRPTVQAQGGGGYGSGVCTEMVTADRGEGDAQASAPAHLCPTSLRPPSCLRGTKSTLVSQRASRGLATGGAGKDLRSSCGRAPFQAKPCGHRLQVLHPGQALRAQRPRSLRMGTQVSSQPRELQSGMPGPNRSLRCDSGKLPPPPAQSSSFLTCAMGPWTWLTPALISALSLSLATTSHSLFCPLRFYPYGTSYHQRTMAGCCRLLVSSW